MAAGGERTPGAAAMTKQLYQQICSKGKYAARKAPCDHYGPGAVIAATAPVQIVLQPVSRLVILNVWWPLGSCVGVAWLWKVLR